MNLRNIIIGVVIIIVLYLLYMWFFGDHSRTYLCGMQDARKSITVSGDNMPSGASADYTFSTWIYVSNWNYRVGEKKTILSRKDKGGNPAPVISLGASLNNVEVDLGTYSTDSADGVSVQPDTCTLENVPIQAWANIIITLNNRALDLYLDGKLVRTCVLSGVPKMSSGEPLVIAGDGGFEGYISNVQYLSRAVNPREAYAIYREGPSGGNIISNFINKYRIKVAFMKDNKEVNSLEI